MFASPLLSDLRPRREDRSRASTQRRTTLFIACEIVPSAPALPPSYGFHGLCGTQTIVRTPSGRVCGKGRFPRFVNTIFQKNRNRLSPNSLRPSKPIQSRPGAARIRGTGHFRDLALRRHESLRLARQPRRPRNNRQSPRIYPALFAGRRLGLGIHREKREKARRRKGRWRRLWEATLSPNRARSTRGTESAVLAVRRRRRLPQPTSTQKLEFCPHLVEISIAPNIALPFCVHVAFSAVIPPALTPPTA